MRSYLPQLESSPHSPELEKDWHSNEDPVQPITNKPYKVGVILTILQGAKAQSS